MRYVEVKIIFTAEVYPDIATGILEFYDLRVDLNVKVKLTVVPLHADKDDVGGTLVLFNKVFQGINSITVDVDSIEPCTLFMIS